MPPPTLKVCVLGSTGVGKTKMIKRFVYNQYDEEYEPTVAKGGVSYYISVVLNGGLYLLRLIDMPMIKEFPADTLAEWSEYHQCLLRTAHAYIFVFDLNVPATFYYVKGERWLCFTIWFLFIDLFFRISSDSRPIVRESQHAECARMDCGQ